MNALEQNIDKLQGNLSRFKKSGITDRIAGKDHAGSEDVFATGDHKIMRLGV